MLASDAAAPGALATLLEANPGSSPHVFASAVCACCKPYHYPKLSIQPRSDVTITRSPSVAALLIAMPGAIVNGRLVRC